MGNNAVEASDVETVVLGEHGRRFPLSLAARIMVDDRVEGSPAMRREVDFS